MHGANLLLKAGIRCGAGGRALRARARRRAGGRQAGATGACGMLAWWSADAQLTGRRRALKKVEKKVRADTRAQNVK